MRARQAHITRWGRLLALGGLLSAGLEGCGQGEDLTAVPVAVLRVTTATTGPAPGAYTLAVDGSGPTSVGPVDTLIRSGLAPGQHTVELGVPAVCAVDSGGFRTITASEGDTTALGFVVACAAATTEPFGALVVTVTTTGVDLDPDGYLVGVDPSASRTVGLNESLRFDSLAAGAHLVRLSGLAASCSVQDENPRTVEIVANTDSAVSFAVRCWPPATGTIAFAHGRDFDATRQVELMSLDGTVLDQLFTLDEFHDWPSWSPVGGFLAFTAGASQFASDHTVFVQDPSEFSPLALPGCYPTGDRPQWSSDGARLLCLSEIPIVGGALTSVRRDGSDERSLSPAGLAVVNASFLPDGSVVFATDKFSADGATVYHVGGNGGTPVRLFDLPSDIFGVQDLIVVSPDGSRMTYVRFAAQTGDLGLYVVRLDGDGTDARLVSGDLIVGDWSPPAWSPDGTRLAFVGSPSAGPYGIWLVASDGSGLTRLPLPGVPGFESAVAWSPDGSRLVVNVVDVDSGGQIAGSTIYVIRADGSGLQQLTAGGTYDAHPVWAP